jgi:hypothetical protein
MEQITIPTSPDTRPGAWVVLSQAEAAQIARDLRQALDWQPNALTQARCRAAVDQMRSKADEGLGVLNHADSLLTYFFGPEGGAFSSLHEAWSDAPIESLPGYGETVVQGSNLIRRYPGGVIVLQGRYQAMRNALIAFNSLRTGGCGIALGGPLAIVGGAALTAGLIIWWAKSRKQRAR